MPPFCELHQVYHHAHGDHVRMTREENRRRINDERRAQAERIARSTPLPATWIAARVDMTEELQEAIVIYGTAAALAGLEATR